MKRLMGLIMSLTLAAGLYAQDMTEKDYHDEDASGKNRPAESTIKEDNPTTSESTDGEDANGFSNKENLNPEMGIQRSGNTGSVYYFNPSDEMKMEMDVYSKSKSQNSSDVVVTTEPENITDMNSDYATDAGDVILGKQCALNKLLHEREGAFKERNKNFMGGELKMGRNKNGDASLRFENENEYYEYEENDKGENRYNYGIKNNEAKTVEVYKNEDGLSQVMVEGEFQALDGDDMGTFKERYNLENINSVCNP